MSFTSSFEGGFDSDTDDESMNYGSIDDDDDDDINHDASFLSSNIYSRHEPKRNWKFFANFGLLCCAYPLVGLCLGTCLSPFTTILAIPYFFIKNTAYNFLLIYRKITCYTGRIFQSRLDLEDITAINANWKILSTFLFILIIALPPIFTYVLMPYYVSLNDPDAAGLAAFLSIGFLHLIVILYLLGFYLKRRIEEKVEIPLPTNVVNTEWFFYPSAAEEFYDEDPEFRQKKPIGEFDRFLNLLCSTPNQNNVPILCCHARRAPILAYIGLFLEFMALSALSLTVYWDGGYLFSIVRSTFLATIFDFPYLSSSNSFHTTGLILFLLPLSFIVISSSLAVCLGLSGTTAWNSAVLFIYQVADYFNTAGTLIFIGYYANIIKMLSCQYHDNNSNRGSYLDAFPGEICWSPQHQGYALIAMYNLVLCLPLLLGFVMDPFQGGMSPDPDKNYRPDYTRNVWSKPSFLLKDAGVKMLGIGLGIAFSKKSWVVLLTSALTVVILLFMVIVEMPSFHWLINLWRISFLFGALWTAISSFVALMVANTSLAKSLPFNLLGFGWLFIFFATLIFIRNVKSDYRFPNYKIFPLIPQNNQFPLYDKPPLGGASFSFSRPESTSSQLKSTTLTKRKGPLSAQQPLLSGSGSGSISSSSSSLDYETTAASSAGVEAFVLIEKPELPSIGQGES